MKDEDRTKGQLMAELVELRRRNSELEASRAERKRVEEQILRQSAVLNAINKVLQETLTCETDEEVAHTCLTVAEDLTDSKFGFIGEVNEAGRYDTIALSNPGWDSCKVPKSNAVVMIKDMEIRGIWGRVLKDGTSLTTNTPSSHPDSVGIPEGHPLLTAFLGVPLKYAGETIGMIALANKESGYDHSDQEAVEILSVSFVEALMRKRTVSELRRRDEAEKQRLFEEVQRAHEMQVNLFPEPLPQMAGLDIWGVCHPMNEVGGDFFDYLHLGSDKLCLALGDASEKGMKGAMNAIMTYGMLHAEARTDSSSVTIISKINAALSACMEETTFTTLSLGIIDVQTKKIQLCNGGNPFPILLRGGRASLLELSGLPLGIIPDMDYSEMQLELMPGDVLVLYSDGFAEARRPDDQMYSMDRMRDLVGTFQPNLSAQSMAERIIQEVRGFVGDSPQSDDMTIIVARVLEDKEMFDD